MDGIDGACISKLFELFYHHSGAEEPFFLHTPEYGNTFRPEEIRKLIRRFHRVFEDYAASWVFEYIRGTRLLISQVTS